MTNLAVRRSFGYTKYKIRIESDNPLSLASGTGESELTFPMDVLAAAASASVSGEIAQGKPWRLTLRIEKNIDNPGDEMTDSDWIIIPYYHMRDEISSTESDAELSSLVMDFSGRVQLSRWKGLALDGLMGYKRQTLSYDIYGVRGWHLDLEPGTGERVYFDLFKGVNVLRYEVTYNIPYAGISAGWSSSPASPHSDAFALRGEFAYSPAAFAADRDDHILRNKLAEGKCKGTSLAARLDVTWIHGFARGRFAWSLQFGGDLLAITARGDQKQRFYGDDPSTGEDETGLAVTGLDDKIESRQQAVHVSFGLRF